MDTSRDVFNLLIQPHGVVAKHTGLWSGERINKFLPRIKPVTEVQKSLQVFRSASLLEGKLEDTGEKLLQNVAMCGFDAEKT